MLSDSKVFHKQSKRDRFLPEHFGFHGKELDDVRFVLNLLLDFPSPEPLELANLVRLLEVSVDPAPPKTIHPLAQPSIWQPRCRLQKSLQTEPI